MPAPDPVNPRKRRKWVWLTATTALLLTTAAGLVWWAPRDDPLTAEEQQFVGCWKPSSAFDYLWANDPTRTEAVEYRADRTVRAHCIDTRTGERFVVEVPWKWYVSRGHLIMVYPSDPLAQAARGDFRLRDETDDRITWQGPDRYLSDREKLPPGSTGSTVVYTRCPAPEGP